MPRCPHASVYSFSNCTVPRNSESWEWLKVNYQFSGMVLLPDSSSSRIAIRFLRRRLTPGGWFSFLALATGCLSSPLFPGFPALKKCTFIYMSLSLITYEILEWYDYLSKIFVTIKVTHTMKLFSVKQITE
jgi:hypothetical protein